MAGMNASGFDPDEDFYEEDEPLEKIRAAFAQGLKGVTARPTKVDLPESPFLQPGPSSQAWPSHVSWDPAATRPIVVAAASAS